MSRLSLCFGIMLGTLLLLLGGTDAISDDENLALKGALLERLGLPFVNQKVADLDKSTPTEIVYGLRGNSVGRNGLRDEVDNHDILQNGKKVNEARYNFFDKYAWAEKGGTWGPPGFQYYIFRHPLVLTYDPKMLEFTLSTKFEFKAAVAINYDTGVLSFKPWVFADTGFGNQWPNVVDISIKSKVSFVKDGKLATKTTTEVSPKKPIVLQTLHGVVKKDCSPEFVQFLKREIDKLAAKLDAEVIDLESVLSK